jgi:hypothetical protein
VRVRVRACVCVRVRVVDGQKGAVTETEFATMSVLKMISNQQV